MTAIFVLSFYFFSLFYHISAPGQFCKVALYKFYLYLYFYINKQLNHFLLHGALPRTQLRSHNIQLDVEGTPNSVPHPSRRRYWQFAFTSVCVHRPD